MCLGVALFPYTNITILFGSAMKNLKILHLTCDFLASNKNHARPLGPCQLFIHTNIMPLSQTCTPFLYVTHRKPGNRCPLPVPGPNAISNGTHHTCTQTHRTQSKTEKVKNSLLTVWKILGPK